jgi:methyl-accepting chemotaxis protein
MYASFEELSTQMMLDKDLQGLLEDVAQADKDSYQFQEIAGKIEDKVHIYAYSNN